jgi:hypothetical protein
VPGGNLAKASSVGANTVNGPGLFNVSTNPAAWTAATKVLNASLLTAISTISGIDFTSHLPKVLKNSKSCLSFINDNSDKIYSDDFLNIFLYIKWINALMQYWGLVH